MPRRTDLTEAEIGAELVRARAANVPWKVLMARYKLGRTRLWMLWRAATQIDGEELSGRGRIFGEKIIDQIGHPPPGQEPEGGRDIDNERDNIPYAIGQCLLPLP